MEGVFRFEGRMFRMAEKAGNLIKLNLIWILFSLPLITGGAALCALHVTAVRILKNEEGYVFRDFWTVFRKKMIPSIKLWIPLLAAASVLVFDYVFWKNVDGNLADFMRAFVCILMGMWTALVFYVFPLAARMDTSAGTTLRNGFLLLFKYLPQSMYLLLITGIFLAAGLLWTPVFYVIVLSGGSLTAVIHGKLLLWIFRKEAV